MGYRFLDDYDPQKEKKKKQQNGALSAPSSSNSSNPFAANNNNKKQAAQPAGAAQTTQNTRTTRGTALGGSAATPVQLPKQVTVPRLTKASAAPIQKTTAPQQLKLPTIQAFGAGDYSRAGKAMDRAAKTVAAGALGAAAGGAEIAGQFRPTTGQQSLGQFSGFGDLGRAVRENRTKGTDISESIRQQEQQRRVRQKLSQQKIFGAADRLTERGQQYEREAKQGLGTVGQFLVDMGVTGTQMAGDMLANLILPGSGLAMMGMRSYGQAAGEARREGKSEQQQFLAGLKSAGIEVFTEKMFGAFSKVYGGAAADELIEKMVGKLTGNATGQALLTWMINAVGEGVEEVTSDLLNPLADRLLGLDDGKGPIWSVDDLAQWGYDILLGTAMGTLGGGTQLARGVRQGRAQTAESRYYDDLRRNGLGSAAAAENARRAGDAMERIMPETDGLRMPRLTTYAERQAAEYRGEKPQNVSDPRIGRLELSSEKYNPSAANVSTVYGNRYRQQVKEDAIRRLGIADGKPAYLVASNITKNGQEYYVDVTKASLNKLLFTKNHEPLELERLLLVDNLEKAIDGSYWAESNGDRKGRTQIDGFDTLRTSFYIDGIPYYADIKVKVVDKGAGQNPQNVAYYIEPEEITSIKKADTQSPTEGRHAPHIFFRDGVSAYMTSVPQSGTGVNMQGMQNGGEYAATPAAPLQMPRLTDEQGRTYEQRQAAQTFNSETKSDAVGVLSLLRSNIKTLHEMQPVTHVTGSEVEQSGKATERVYNFFRSIGGKVRREGFGDVLFSKSRVRNSVVGHGAGEAKVQLAAAVPSVIEHGAEINYTPNWKGRGYDSYVFAAPVDYNGMETYVVAIVTRDNANRYYLHEALDGEGNLIYKKPEGPDVASDSPTAEPQNTIADTEPSVDTTIPQGREGVNTYGMQHGGQYASGPDGTAFKFADTNNNAAQELSRGVAFSSSLADTTSAASGTSIPNNSGNVNMEQYSTGRGLDDLADNDGRRLQVPRLTTYEEGGRAKAEAEKASARDRVRQMDAMTDAAAERAMEQRTRQEQANREMPEALKKLGVEPFGSETDYAGADSLAQSVHGNSSARKQMQKQMSKIPATEKERTFARRLADGTLDAADIPNTVNRETVEMLADYYRTMDTAPETMLLRQRRAAIFEKEETKMEPLLGMDVTYDEGGLRTDPSGLRKPSGKIAKQFSTLRRNLQTPARICATEWGPEHGKKVYETLFYPVTENNGRQIDWVNSMLDRVRTFKDSEGNDRPLNRKERELVQKIVEYRAAEKRVDAFDTQYKGAVDNVRNGASATDAAKEFGIDPSYQEYQDLQNYQTYLKALDELNDSKSADSTAVSKAVEAYSGIYKELYEGINSFLVAHGYQTIGFIEGYAPHMQPEAEKTAFSKALKLLGLDDTAMSLPTSISGKTADLKPYKQYNPFFQERHGVNTEYDIAKGFEDYVCYLGNIFYHTDDIMRIRTAERYIRKTYSSEEAGEQIGWAENARNFADGEIADFLRMNGVIQKGTELAAGDARVFLEDYIGKLYDQIGNVTRYSEMAKYLDNYANRLAGKQNMVDRGAEAAAGRGSLNWINTLTGKYGGAKLAFNVSSALNQTSQIPMVAAENGERATLRAIGDFFKKEKADFAQESNFLKGKKGITWLLGPETGWEKFKEAGFAMTEAVDSFTSYVAVRSKYLKEVNAGKSHAEAMKLADEYGRSVMGSRARGEKPVLFDTKNPFWQIVTRFQLEAMNSWEHVSRDIPNEVRQMAREQGKAHAAGVMGVRVAKYLTYAFLLNLGVGALSGGSPVPYDVIGSVLEALGKSMGVSKLAIVDDVLQSIFDIRLFGTDDDDDDEADRDWWAFLKSLGGDAVNDVPVVGQVAALLGVGDQTLPTTDLSKVKDFAESVKNNGILSMDTLDKGLTAAGEFAFGGNQLRKTLQGGIAVSRGGVYSKGKLRYPVDQTPMNYAKGVLFGRSALDESQAYYADRTSDFSEKQTEAFRQMQDRGVSAKASYDLIQELRSIEKTEESTKAERQRDALRQSDISGAGKWVTYYQTMASETERKTMDAVRYNSEADYGTVTNLLMDLKEQEKDADKMRLIDRSRLSDSQKASLYKRLVAGDDDLEKIDALKETGITDYQYLQYKIATSGLTKREAKLNAINTLDLTDNQKDALYYLNSYASSTHGKAPWVQGMTAEQSDIRLTALLAAEVDNGDDTPKWQQSLNNYLGKSGYSSVGNSAAAQMLANIRRQWGISDGGYTVGSDPTVSEMLANIRRLSGGQSYSSGGNLTVSEMLENVRRKRATMGQ